MFSAINFTVLLTSSSSSSTAPTLPGGMSPNDIRIYDLANEISARTSATPCDASALIRNSLRLGGLLTSIPAAKFINLALTPYNLYWGCE